MNKQLSLITMFISSIVGLILLSAFGFQQKDNKGKNDKAAQQQQEKGNQKAANPGQAKKTAVVNNGQGQNQGKGNANAQTNKGQGNQNNGNANANSGRANSNNGKGNDMSSRVDNQGRGNENRNEGRAKMKNIGGDNWYSWNRENFNDRKQVRNKGKVTICHKFRGNEEPVNITVSENAMKAHMAHGDVVGNCPPVRNSIFSDIFQRRRTSYYNDLYYGQDQYNYSNSVLEYALMRLADSRSQLDYMRVNNYSQADIDRRQAAVLGLEQNVSVLETLLGVAGQYLASRLL